MSKKKPTTPLTKLEEARYFVLRGEGTGEWVLEEPDTRYNKEAAELRAEQILEEDEDAEVLIIEGRVADHDQARTNVRVNIR